MSVEERVPTTRKTHPGARTAPGWHRTLPERLAILLRNAHSKEQRAFGEQRRAAYRLTRQVISSLLNAGYPTRLIATELGLLTESVRTRAQAGQVHLEDIATLSGVKLEDLVRGCETHGIVADDEGRVTSDDLVRILSSAAAVNSNGR
jgi:hypothetical protein